MRTGGEPQNVHQSPTDVHSLQSLSGPRSIEMIYPCQWRIALHTSLMRVDIASPIHTFSSYIKKIPGSTGDGCRDAHGKAEGSWKDLVAPAVLPKNARHTGCSPGLQKHSRATKDQILEWIDSSLEQKLGGGCLQCSHASLRPLQGQNL